MTVKLLGVAAVGLLLTACAHAYPDLATFSAPERVSETDEVAPILDEAARLQKKYSDGYKETAKWQDISQLPIVGAAAAAAWILLENHKNAATRAGKIGVGALAYSGARDQLTAKGLPDAYIAGHGALTCILAEGSMFSGRGAESRHEALQVSLQSIVDGIQRVSELRDVPIPAGEYADLLKAAATLANQAIASARTAETPALTQEAAFQMAAPTFARAVSSVSVRVASKGRVRPPVDFASLRDQMAKAPEPGGNAPGGRPSTQRQIPADPAERLAELTRATNDLMAATANLAASTPNYTKSLESVRTDCVNLAPS